jgi:RNA polymerase sigma-70 factor (ECF subfamily)
MNTNQIPSEFASPRDQESDDQLLSEARSGDQQAFAELCQRYRAMLMSKILRIVRHREDAEDVLQETLLSAYQHLESFRGAGRFSTWMARIGINRSLMLLRKRKSLLETSTDVSMDDGQRFEALDFRDPGPNPEQRYIAHQRLYRLQCAMQRLPPRARALMDLYYEQGRRLKDAAETLNINVAAAKSGVLRARQRLRRSCSSGWAR